MDFGVSMFMTDYAIGAAELARALEERGFEVAVEPGALAYPAVAQDAVPRRRRPAENVLRRDGPVRDAERRGGGRRRSSRSAPASAW